MLIEHGHLPSAGDATALLVISLMIGDKENDDG